MVVGICQLDLRIPENHSLKEKRHVLRKLIDRVRHRFNVAISEVGIMIFGNGPRLVSVRLEMIGGTSIRVWIK